MEGSSPWRPTAMMLLHLHAVDDVQGLALVADDVAGVVHYLRPSLFLTLLVTLVVLSSIRAAVLFMRAPKSNKVVLVRQVKQESEKHALAEKSPSTSTAPQTSSATTPAPGLQAADRQRAPMVSWLWGLVKWDRLPPLPVDRAEATMSQTERGWQPPLSSPPPRRQTQFDQTVMYQSDVPLSMAKLIMSRHTFRRPASRPPPARSTSAPQYQRRLPSMV